MLDKDLIKKRFKKSLDTYDKNASVQKIMADELLSLIPIGNYKDILEIGSFTGNFTKRVVNLFNNFKSYLALDIVKESKQYLSKIDNRIEFINCDIENFKTDKKFDLIVANASLQWLDDICNSISNIKKLLKKDGVLAISIFSKNNLFEIKDTFNISLNYKEVEEIKKVLSKNAKILEKNYVLKFDNPRDVLRHLKETGVNAIKTPKFSISELKEKMRVLNKNYNNKITYYPIYIIDIRS